MPTGKSCCGCGGHVGQGADTERGTDPTRGRLLVRRMAGPRQSVALKAVLAGQLARLIRNGADDLVEVFR